MSVLVLRYKLQSPSLLLLPDLLRKVLNLTDSANSSCYIKIFCL